MSTTVDLELRADLRDATRSIKQFGIDSTSALAGVEKGFGFLKVAAAAAVGFIAGREIISGIKAVTEAAGIQENAVTQLNTALKLSGDFSVAASRDMQDFASQIQSISTVGDEVILGQLALAKSFNLSNDSAKELVEAAVDLSAATGMTLDGAVRNLGKTFAGMTGELGETIPALKSFTKEQLEAGAALEYVADRFGGAAQEMSGTFAGSLTQVKNLWGDLNEELGFLITRNPVVIKSLQMFAGGIEKAIAFLKNNSGTISVYISQGLKAIISVIPYVLKAMGGLITGLSNVNLAFKGATYYSTDFVDSLLELDQFQLTINLVTKPLLYLGKVIAELHVSTLAWLDLLPGFDMSKQIQGARDLVAAYDTKLLENNALELKQQFAEVNETARETFAEANTDFDKLIETVADLTNASEDAVSAIMAVGDAQVAASDAATGALENQIKALKELMSLEDIEKNVARGIANPIASKEQFREWGLGPVEFEKDSKAPGQIGQAAGLFQAMLGGAEGARKLFSGVSAAFADAFIPGLGAAVGPIVDILAQGPEKVREMVNGFADAIPEIIDNLAEAIPAVAIALAEKADVIISALVKLSYKIPLEMTRAMPEVAKALLNEIVVNASWHLERIGAVFTHWGEQISEGLTNMITGIFDPKNGIIAKLGQGIGAIFANIDELSLQKIKDAGEAFFESIKRAADELINKLRPGGSDGKIGGGLGTFGNAVKQFASPITQYFATGGYVTGTGTADTVPAMLTPGELVVDRTTGPRLNRFLDEYDGGGAGNQAMLALLARILDAVSAPITVQTTAEVDGRAFADIELHLRRTNARTA